MCACCPPTVLMMSDLETNLQVVKSSFSATLSKFGLPSTKFCGIVKDISPSRACTGVRDWVLMKLKDGGNDKSVEIMMRKKCVFFLYFKF